MKRRVFMTLLMTALILTFQPYANAEDKAENPYKIPDSALSISKENTYSNGTQDLPYLHPSELAQEFLNSTDEKITNPDLIRLLNESHIGNPLLGIGLRVSVYLGEWPLAYETAGTEVNWQYQKVNTNYLDNRGAQSPAQMTYSQDQQKKVTGGLTAAIPNAEAVRKMMMIHAGETTGLPLSFDTVIGQGTRKNQTYNVSTQQVGYLHSYVPAIHEKGNVTYGEVYVVVKGGKKRLEVKNITQQGIGAWIPVQDYLSFTYMAKN
ncbi:YfkD famly protein [Alkalicoccobacillus plakortidis]|uniref:YfkD family protein n=1 Tax=Alkalicoccobacillus plakortidis TaxID=444060 RepID=A0ABT0XLJ2_9BACI|nr:YfkD famly protein [Alkalicoccobacillus plakortidis]MCM2676779.1 YfkD family protein [Alkalicoccobacillus plakortidis]